MKKIGPYCMLSAIFFALSVVLSLVFDFSLTNTWQALVSLLFVFGPLWICSWEQLSVHKGNHQLFYYVGKFGLILLVIGYLITGVAFFVGLI